MKVAVLGASGNVGRRVVAELLAHGDDVVGRVLTVSRRAVDAGTFPRDPRLEAQVVDMSSAAALEAACRPLLGGVDAIVATMGIGSGRGGADLFQRVEVELPSAFARAAAAAGVPRAVLLTAVGADLAWQRSLFFRWVAGGQFFHFKWSRREELRRRGISSRPRDLPARRAPRDRPPGRVARPDRAGGRPGRPPGRRDRGRA